MPQQTGSFNLCSESMHYCWWARETNLGSAYKAEMSSIIVIVPRLLSSVINSADRRRQFKLSALALLQFHYTDIA